MNFKQILLTVIIIAPISFFAGMEYKAYQIKSAISNAVDEFAAGIDEIFDVTDSEDVEEQRVQSKDNDESLPSTESESLFVDVGVGDGVELATITFTVNSVTEKQSISGTFGSPAIAAKGAKFVLLDVDITNTTDSGFSFFADDGFRLVDEKGREFEEYENSIGSIKNYLAVRTLAPGITENGVLVYEIPADAESYYWTVGKGGTDEIYRVKLQ